MDRLPFQIKICGVTTRTDALLFGIIGTEAIGLNFYLHSKRNITKAEATRIYEWLRMLPPKRVGVFVNPTLLEIATACSSPPPVLPPSKPRAPENVLQDINLSKKGRLFDWVQLHGVEPPEFLADVKSKFGLSVIRAFPWGPNAHEQIDSYLERCLELGCLPDAVLIDSHKPGEYGGTGETADWESIAQWRENRRFDIPLVLAGGLTPENVAQAIRLVRPDAVDTASGVESAPGRKDPARVQAFIAEAKQAFAAIG